MISSVRKVVLGVRNTLMGQRTVVTALVAVWVATCAIALLVPIGISPVAEGEAVVNAAQHDRQAAGAEDLSGFLRSERWGVSLEEIRESLAAPAGSVASGEDQELGYLGFVARKDSATVLLRLPDGSLEQLRVGDSLADGRKLAEFRDTRLTLSGPNRQEEELLLFPDLEEEGLLTYPDIEYVMHEKSQRQLPE